MALSLLASSTASSATPIRSQAAAARGHSLSSAASSFAAPRSLQPRSSSSSQRAGRSAVLQVRAGNHATTGPFAPLVVVVRNAMGVKEFNQLRGKAISLHSQVIKTFCGQLGADGKQVQGLIRLAKKNGEKLGFLA